jgi:hypothetical protein
MREHAMTDCSGMGDRSYQIQVLDGTGAIMAVGTISGGSYDRDERSYGIFIQCDFTYTVELEPSHVYTFVVAARAAIE